MELITENTFKDAKLSDVVASAHYELEVRQTAFPTALYLVRELGRRIQQNLYDENGNRKVLPPEHVALWHEAFMTTFPHVADDAERDVMLTELQNDLVSLKDYRGKDVSPARIEVVMAFLTAYRDCLLKAEKVATAPAKDDGWGPDR